MMVEKRKIRKGDTRRRQQRGVSRNFRLFRKTDGFLSFLIVSAYILISDAAATTSFGCCSVCGRLVYASYRYFHVISFLTKILINLYDSLQNLSKRSEVNCLMKKTSLHLFLNNTTLQNVVVLEIKLQARQI